MLIQFQVRNFKDLIIIIIIIFSMTPFCEPSIPSHGTFSFEADIEDKIIRCDRQKLC